MSDMIDMFRDLGKIRQAQRRVFGVPCPVCREKLPKAHPKLLQPGQWCRAHKPHYRDPRDEPSIAEYNEKMAAAGYDIRRLAPEASMTTGATAEAVAKLAAMQEVERQLQAASIASSRTVITSRDLMREAADALEYATARIAELEGALCQCAADFEEHADHAQTRLEDGDELGSTVWKIALQDIKREALDNAKRARSVIQGGGHG